MNEKEILDLKRISYISVIDFLIKSKEIDNWQMPYFQTKYNNGLFFEDLNPIISFISFHKKKIVKISHDEDLISNFESWTSDFDNNTVLNVLVNIKHFSIVNDLIYDFVKND